MKSCRRAARHDAATGPHRPHALFEHLAADVLDHDIDATLLGQRLALGDEVLLRVIDRDIGADAACTLELVLAARGRDHARTEQLRDLNRGDADARPSTLHEHDIARRYAGFVD